MGFHVGSKKKATPVADPKQLSLVPFPPFFGLRKPLHG